MRDIKKFIQKNQPIWKEYVLLLEQAKTSPNILKQLRDLYPVIASHYSYLNQYNLKQEEVIQIKNRLEGYLFESRLILNVKPSLNFFNIWSAFIKYCFLTIPTIIYKNRKLILLATIFSIISFFFSFLITLYFPSNVTVFLPLNEYLYYANNIEADLKYQKFFGEDDLNSLHFLESILNFSKIICLFLIGGLAFGVGCFFLLAQHFFSLGAILALYYKTPYFKDCILQIAQHGILYYLTIILTSASGIIIGSSYYFSGNFKIKDVLKKKSKEAFALIALCSFLFLCSSYIECFISTKMLDFSQQMFLISISIFFPCAYIVYCLDKRSN